MPPSDKFSSELQYQAELLEATHDAIIARDPADGSISFWNRAAEALYGWARAEAVGRVEHTMLNTQFPESREAVDAALAAAGVWEGELVRAARDGTARIVASRQVLQQDASGRPCAIVGIDRDLTEYKAMLALQNTLLAERMAALETARYGALHDALTDLPNRILLQDRLQHEIERARRDRSACALLLLDLDGFKEINDALGHHIGDQLLQVAGARIRSTVRQSDTVARLGGDEFAILLPLSDGAGALTLGHKILARLEEPVQIQDYRLSVRGSIGVALFPGDGQSAEAVLQRADIAMYLAKRRRSGVASYDPVEDTHTPGRLALIAELRTALAESQLVLHYQPKVDLITGAVPSVEALVRWQHPTRGLLFPAAFISMAEQTGFITPLTTWVVRAALQQWQTWSHAGTNLRIAVNLSPVSLRDDHLVGTILELLTASGIEPIWLELEITETTLMEAPERVMRTLAQLHDHGVRIAIDDFGVGHSSLAYLAHLPADEIKIDRSFVRAVSMKQPQTIVMRSIVDLGHNLTMDVVAEGVEDEVTAGMLREMGCDLAQGYHLYRPAPPDELMRSLHSP